MSQLFSDYANRREEYLPYYRNNCCLCSVAATKRKILVKM